MGWAIRQRGPIRKPSVKGRAGDAGGRRADDERRPGDGFDLRVDRALHVGALEHALLRVGRTLQRVGEAGGDGDARPRGRRIVDQAMTFERREVGLDPRERGRALAFRVVVERDPVAGAGEDDGPGAADEAGADDRDFVRHDALLRRPGRRCG